MNYIVLNCTKCGELIPGRVMKRKDATCFDCKMKSNREREQNRYKNRG